MNLGADTTICSGDTLILDAGAGATSYSWSTGSSSQTIQATMANTYSVTATFGVCVASDTTVVTVSQYTLSDTLNACNADSVLLDAGTGFVSYLWDDGLTSQSRFSSMPDNHFVTVTDAFGCVFEDSIFLNLIDARILQGDTSICFGDAVELNPPQNVCEFEIISLSASNAVTALHGLQSGDDKGGLAITPNHFYYTGDTRTIRRNADNLGFNVNLPQRDGIFGDLATGTLYTFWNIANNDFNDSLLYINHIDAIRVMDSNLNYGAIIPLSDTIKAGLESGVFAGPGFVLLWAEYNGTFYHIDLSTGQVSTLGTFYGFGISLFESEGWASWGIAECDSSNTNFNVLYRSKNNNSFGTNSTDITRFNINDSTFTSVANFPLGLAEMACITYSPWANRWYFQYEGTTATFGASSSTLRLGYADAVATGLSGFGTNGILPLSYVWSNGSTMPTIPVTPTVATDYSVSVSRAGNTCSDTVNVSVIQPVAFNLADTISICNVDSVLVDAGPGYSSYNWSDGQTTQIANFQIPGIYDATITGSNGCPNSDTVNVSFVDARITPGDTTICSDDTIMLRATGNCGFSISSIGSSNALTVGHGAFTGNSYGGMAVTANHLFYTGENHSVRMNADDLSNLQIVPKRDGLFSDLGTGTLYTFLNSINSSFSTANINALRLMDTNLSISYGATIPLSQTIDAGSTGSMVFAGPGFVILWANSNNTFYHIELATGLVSNLGVFDLSDAPFTSASWAGWGIAECNGGGNKYSVVFHPRTNSTLGLLDNTIVRFDIASSTFTVVTTFPYSLGGLTSMTYSPWHNRWYFQNPGTSLIFGGSLKSIGFADATAIGPNGLGAGNFGNLTYNWSNGSTMPWIDVSPDSTTDYAVTVTDGITICTDNITVTSLTPVGFNLPDTLLICDTDFHVMDAGAGFSSYQWSTGDTTQTLAASLTGNYTATVTGLNGCPASRSTYFNLLESRIVQNDTLVCSSDTVSLSLVESCSFRMNSFLTTGVTMTNSNVGDDRAGIAITPNYFYYVGDGGTAKRSTSNFTTPTFVLDRRDGIFSDLNTGLLYTFWRNFTSEFYGDGSNVHYIDAIRTMDEDLNYVEMRLLSQTITPGVGSAVFAGPGMVIVWANSNNTFYKISLATGLVTNLGVFDIGPALYPSEGWASWGLAECDPVLDEYSVVFRSQFNASFGTGLKTISRFDITNSTMTNVSTFAGFLGDMSDITYSPWDGHWYFHTESPSSEFGGSPESHGRVDATATGPAISSAYTTLWSSGQTGSPIDVVPNATTIYSVTVSDGINTCSDTTTVSVTPPPAVTPSTSLICLGDSVLMQANGSVSYAWSPGTELNVDTGSAVVASPNNNITYSITGTDSIGCTNSSTATVTVAILPVPTISLSNVSCNGAANGSASFSANGGYAPFSFLWTDGNTSAARTGLTAGTYQLTISDINLCEDTFSINITESPALFASVGSINPISCNGLTDGSATIVGAGGVLPYSYLWSNGATSSSVTGLAPGSHSVTITDGSSCTALSSVFIVEPGPITASITSITDAPCANVSSGSASVAANGGTPPYSYVWSSGGTAATETGLAAGNHIVTVSDQNACQLTVPVTIGGPTVPLEGAVVSTTSPTCHGYADGSAVVNATGDYSPFSFLWPSGGIGTSESGLSAGVYVVSVTDTNNCLDTFAVTINEPLPVIGSTVASGSVSCNGAAGGQATVAGVNGVAPYTYAWPSGAIGPTDTGLTVGTYTVTITDSNSCIGTHVVTIAQPLPLNSVISSSDISCFSLIDGQAAAAATGGTSPYSFNWSSGGTSNSISSLASGTYTVTTTDANNCQTVDSVIIVEPLALNGSIMGVTDVSCLGGNDGQATVVVAGGTPPYSILWASGSAGVSATNLAAGSQNVTVTDTNGCQIQLPFVLNEPSSAVNVAISGVTNVTCNGGNNGSLSVVGFGGTAPYTFLWSNGGTGSSQTSLTAGIYTITVTDTNGCQSSVAAVINQPTLIQLNVLSSIPASCNGAADGSATIGASGGSGPYTFAWSSGNTTTSEVGLSAGSYNVTVTDQTGCAIVDAVVITEPVVLGASVVSITNVSCNGLADAAVLVTGTGGTTPFTYIWPSGTNGPSETGLSGGMYTVTVSDNNGCQTTNVVSVSEPSPLDLNLTGINNVSCFGGNDGSAMGSSSGGTMPYTYNWPGGSGSTINGLTAGTFVVSVMDANGCSDTTSLIITEPTVLIPSVASSTPALCNGTNTGAASLTATGGTGPYSYLWPGGGTTASESGLTAGTYAVTVTDNLNCSDTIHVLVNEPTVLSTSLQTVINVSCNGLNDGQATVAVSGGVPSYTYNWPSGTTTASETGLSAGTYTVTITDANACMDSIVVTVTEPAALNASISGFSNVTCNAGSDGTALAASAGGTSPYSFAWPSGNNTSAMETGLTAGTYTVTITDNQSCSDTVSVVITQPALLSVSLVSSTNVLCNGGSTGSATVTATGGTTPYAFNWPSGGSGASETGLMAGAWTVTVTDDNGCQGTLTVAVTEPTLLQTVIDSADSISCNGLNDGQIVTTTSGGVLPYTYSWSSGGNMAIESGLPAGTFTLTVTDANGCTTQSSAALTEPTVLSVSFSDTTHVLCFGDSTGSATALAAGGTLPVAYNWSNGDTGAVAGNLPSGMYVVSATDANNCVAVDSVLLSEPSSITINFVNVMDVNCPTDSNGSAEAQVTGGVAPYSYQWDDNNNQTTAQATQLGVGSYAITASDSNGCIVVNSVTIASTNPLPVVEFGKDSDTICNGSSTVLDIGAGFVTYAWSTGATTQSITVNTTNVYSVTVTDANGCFNADTIAIVVDGPCVGINELADNASIRYFPNPTDGFLTMEIDGLEGQNIQFAVLNIQGKVVTEGELVGLQEKHQHIIDLNSQAQGIYFLRVVTDAGMVVVHRISVL